MCVTKFPKHAFIMHASVYSYNHRMQCILYTVTTAILYLDIDDKDRG